MSVYYCPTYKRKGECTRLGGKCDDPASLEKEKKKNNQKKTKFKNLVVKLQLGYLAIFSNHIIYFDISETLQF